MSTKPHTDPKNYSDMNIRLSNLMKEKGITIQKLSKGAGVAIGTIQKLMTDSSCNPTISSLEAISNALDVPISELIGHDEKMHALNGSRIFLLNWEELPITLANVKKLAANGIIKRETIKTSFTVSQNAFALKMKGSSMLPLFPENAILIFDPDKAPKDGNYIIVQIHNFSGVMFKQLLIDEPYKFVKSINPPFKDNVIKLTDEDKIIAVLVQSQMQY